MSRGFFVPASISGNYLKNTDYVRNQRTARGEYQWDKEIGSVKFAQQASLQSLSKQYNTTIDSAYSNYLLANRGIRGTQIGEGYKEAYREYAQEGLEQNLQETSLNMANLRQQLAQSGSDQIGNIMSRFETEVGNVDRTQASLGDYYAYLQNVMINPESSVYAERMRLAEEQHALLPRKERKASDPMPDLGYFIGEDQTKPLADMYEQLLNASPKDYFDDRGETAMSFIEWLQFNAKDTDRDKSWLDWLINFGGIHQFRESVSKGVKPLK